MKRLLCIITALIMTLGGAAIAASAPNTVAVGAFMLTVDPSWSVQNTESHQLYVYDSTGNIVSNIQYFTYDAFGLTHDELIATGIADDYELASLLIDSINTASIDMYGGELFSTMNTERFTGSCGLSGIRYYGTLNSDIFAGSYCGTILLNSDHIISSLSLNTQSSMDTGVVQAFDSAIIANLSLDGQPVIPPATSAQPDSASPMLTNIFNSINSPEQQDDTVVLEHIVFTTPDGWELIYQSDTQAEYTCGAATITLNAYGTVDYGAFNTMDELSERLIGLLDDTLRDFGIDTTAIEYFTTTLPTGDMVIYCECDVVVSSTHVFMTNALLVKEDGFMGLATIITPSDDPEANPAIVAQSVNMYYDADLVEPDSIPLYAEINDSEGTESISGVLDGISNALSGSTPAATAAPISIPASVPSAVSIAAVTSEEGTSLTDEELSALSDAIGYAATGNYDYNGIVEQLVSDGYSYDTAVFAADNCGI